jgi:site-specific recombinase XerD
MKVKLRSKLTKQGYSLYLDLYKDGKREFEFLDTYVSEDYTSKKGLKNVKSQDKENMTFGRELCDKRQKELTSLEHGITPPSWKNADFLTYYEICYKERKKAHGTFKYTLTHLRAFAKERCSIASVTPVFLNNFCQYLNSIDGVSPNTVVIYMKCLKQILGECVRDGIISQNPFNQFDLRALYKKKVAPEISYLTIEEVRLMENVPSRANTNQHTRNAFLFSCFTGLRISDIKKLLWSEIKDNEIQFTPKKTKKRESLPLSDPAKEILDMVVRTNNPRIFFKLPHENSINISLKAWAKQAGIDEEKEIHFHVARHTFATMLITNGVDLYRASKLLTHSNIQSSQIYTKVDKRSKVEAVSRLPSLKVEKA